MKLIKDVKIKKLNIIPDERGSLMEILRSDDEIFEKFGQLYMTTAYPGVVKGWHYHKHQNDFFYVVKGMVKVVLYDSRKDSETFNLVNEFFMGEKNHIVLKIPAFVYHGFKCISETEGFILNCPTQMYNYENPDEFRVHPHKNDIPYDWERKDG